MAAYNPPLRTFRDMLEAIVPPWLKASIGLRYLYAHSVQIDAFADALTSAIQSRFPGYYSNQTLALIGRERRIFRGLAETDTSYAARLVAWLTAHAHRGSGLAMLGQLYIYYDPDHFPVELIYRNGLRLTLNPDGSITRDYVDFEPDATPEKWAQWSLIMYTDRYGPNPSPEQIREIVAIPSAWNAAHAIGTVILMPTGAEFWATRPPDLWASPAPARWACAVPPIWIPVP